jgi:hypothetical protein
MCNQSVRASFCEGIERGAPQEREIYIRQGLAKPALGIRRGLKPPFGPELPTLTIDITGSASPSQTSRCSSAIRLIGHFGANPLHGVVPIAEW